MQPQGKWWQHQAQLHVGQGLTLMTVPETVTATPFRGDFGQQTLVWTGLKVSTAHSGFVQPEGFHSILLLPAHSEQGVCFTEHITALGGMLG